MYKTVILVSIAAVALTAGILMVRKVKFSNLSIPLFSKIQFSWLYLLTFIVVSFFRIYWDTQKTGFFVDEYYQISVCNPNDEGMSLWKEIKRGELERLRPYKGQELLDKAFFDDESLSDVSNDLVNLWINTEDPSHTALHYMLTRLLFTGVKTHDLSTIIHRECALNYLFFIFSFVIMLRTFSSITKNKWITSLLLFIAFVNPASIYLATFMRSYALQEAAIAAIGYLFIRYFELFNQKTYDFPKSLYIKSLIIITFAISTDYFPVFFVGMCTIVICLRLIIDKQKKAIAYFISVCCFSYCLANVLYPGYGLMLFAGKGVEQINAFSNINNVVLNIYKGLIGVAWNINYKFMDIFFLTAILCINIYIIFKDKTIKEIKKNFFNYPPLVLLLIAGVWILFVMMTAPYKELRYIAPVFILLTLSITPMFEINKKNLPITVIIIVLCCCAAGYRCLPLNINKECNSIPHLTEVRDDISFSNNPSIPVMVHESCDPGRWIPYVNENQTYYLIKDNKDIETLGLKEYYEISPSIDWYWLHEKYIKQQ